MRGGGTRPHLRLGILAGCAAIMAAAPAQAQLYVRAGGSFDFSFFSRLADDDCFSVKAFFGCGDGNDGQPLGAWWDFDNTFTAEAAVGMRLLLGLRGEVAVIWRPEFNLEGGTNFVGHGNQQQVSGEGWNLAAMANVYLDLVDLGLPPLGPFEPFIGAGIGLAYNSVGPLTFDFPGLANGVQTIIQGGDSTSLAYMVTAGVSWPVFTGVRLDIAYRYSDLGSVSTSAGWAEIIDDFGSTMMEIGSTSTDIRSHAVSASIRVGF